MHVVFTGDWLASILQNGYRASLTVTLLLRATFSAQARWVLAFLSSMQSGEANHKHLCL